MENKGLDNLFDKRNEIKKSTNKQKQIIHVNIWDIVYAKIGLNIWNEQNGKWKDFLRPVIIIKKIWIMYFVLPLTSQPKYWKFYFELGKTKLTQKSRCLLGQCKLIDGRRILRYLWKVDYVEFEQIKKLVSWIYNS